jgi:hypothetical protein
VGAYRNHEHPAVLRSAERGPAVVHTLDIDVTVLRARSNNRGVDVERVDNIAASVVPTLRLTVTTERL